MLLASFSVSTVVALAMSGDDCHQQQQTSHCDLPLEHKQCDHEDDDFCEMCDCTIKQSSDPSNIVTLDRAQINEFTAIVATFVISTQKPSITFTEKVQDFSILYSDSLPIYLMNRVLLN